MIRRQQPPLLPFNSKSMSVEIEVLPQEKYYIDLRVRYFIENRQVMELESSISTGRAQQALDWLAKAVKTKRKKITETFSDMLAYEHVMVIEQSRLSEDIFLEIQKDFGAEASPYPFLYDIDVLVNPDPEGNVNAGIGMRFSGLDYSQIFQFLSQLRDEINAALKDRSSGDVVKQNISRAEGVGSLLVQGVPRETSRVGAVRWGKGEDEFHHAQVTEALSKLVEEATKPKPNRKWYSWYSVSIDGLIKAAENIDKLGEPVINLSHKVLNLLTDGVIK